MNISKQATWGQASRLLSLVEEKGLKRNRMEEIYESGILADVLDPDADLTNRRAVRTALHLPPLRETWNIFHLVPSKEKRVVIAPTDGTMTLAKAWRTFAYHAPDVESAELNRQGKPTGPTPVLFYELTGHVSYVKLFSSISDDLDSLVFTQHQIEEFCRNYRGLLQSKKHWTFFLFREDQAFFVAHVSAHSSGVLEVRVCRLKYGLVASGSGPSVHVVVPVPVKRSGE